MPDIDGLAGDAAEMDRLTARLALSEGRLRSISCSLPGYIWMADQTGQLNFTTQAWLDYAGIGESDTLGSGWSQFVHSEDLPRVGAAWARSVTEGVPYSTEFRCRRWDGTYRWFLVRAEAERDASGAVLRWVGMNVEIEQQKTVEAAFTALNTTLEQRVAEASLAREQMEGALRQAQKMEAIGQLTGGIAHDFNNMLQSVLGSLDLIVRRLDQGRYGEIRRLADMAIQGANRAASLTGRLLSFARRQALAPRALDANALVLGMEELIRNTVGGGVRIEFALASPLPAILCDPNQMESALLNLAINARDAMPDGGMLILGTADVTITLAQTIGHPGVIPGRFVELSVADTGFGMPEHVAVHAFEPFFTTKPQGLGTGLGLSQIYGFVRQSGGLVHLESAPGMGTTIRLQFPRYDGPVLEELPSAQPPVTTGRRGIVLLVEDEVVIRTLASEALTEQGWTVIEAHNGVEALPILTSNPAIDIMVTDISLPGGMNGRDLAEAARQARPGLPVLFATGHAETALSDGPMPPRTALIGKPFRLDILLEQVARLLAAA